MLEVSLIVTTIIHTKSDFQCGTTSHKLRKEKKLYTLMDSHIRKDGRARQQFFKEFQKAIRFCFVAVAWNFSTPKRYQL